METKQFKSHIQNVEHLETVVCTPAPVKEIYLFDPIDDETPACFIATSDNKQYVGFDFLTDKSHYTMYAWDVKPTRLFAIELSFNGEYNNVHHMQLLSASPAPPDSKIQNYDEAHLTQHLYLNRKVALVVNNVADSLSVRLLPDGVDHGAQV